MITRREHRASFRHLSPEHTARLRELLASDSLHGVVVLLKSSSDVVQDALGGTVTFRSGTADRLEAKIDKVLEERRAS
jgi:hypothetical protein